MSLARAARRAYVDGPWNLLRDLLQALRTLRKSPVFAGTVVLTLARGIGATTAIFSARRPA